MTGMIHYILRAALIAALLLPDLSQAALYVYKGPAGETLVSNMPVTRPGYKLRHQRESSDGVGHLAAGRKGPTAADVPRFSAVGSKSYKRKWIDSSEYDAYIRSLSKQHGVEPALVKAVIQVESNFDPTAVSRAGAQGLMQLMPGTAAMYKVSGSEVFHPKRNIEAGVRHLAYLKTLFPNNMDFVLAAYNAGENNVIRYNGIPPFPETVDYVQKVRQSHNIFKRVFF